MRSSWSPACGECTELELSTIDPTVLVEKVAATITEAPGAEQRRLTVSLPSAPVVQAIADTGRGITAEELDLVWEELGRAQEARGIEGSGLGLPMVSAPRLRWPVEPAP